MRVPRSNKKEKRQRKEKRKERRNVHNDLSFVTILFILSCNLKRLSSNCPKPSHHFCFSSSLNEPRLCDNCKRRDRPFFFFFYHEPITSFNEIYEIALITRHLLLSQTRRCFQREVEKKNERKKMYETCKSNVAWFVYIVFNCYLEEIRISSYIRPIYIALIGNSAL